MCRRFWGFAPGLFLLAVGFVLLCGPTLARATTVAVVAPTAADLQTSLSAAPDPVTVGDPLTYTIVVHNVGPSIAFSLTIQDLLPTGVNFNGTSTINTLGASNSNLRLTTNALTATVAALFPSGIVTITGRTLVGAAATGSTLLNQVTVSASNDGDLSNNNATVTTRLLPLPATATPVPTPTLLPTPTSSATPQAGSFDLRLVKHSTPATIQPGQELTYTIVVRNLGAVVAQNIVITDTLPSGVRFAGRTHIAVVRGLQPTVVVTGTTLTGQVAQLSPGGLITITSQTMVGVAVTGTALNNTAWMKADGPQGLNRYNANSSTALNTAPTPTTTPVFDPLPYRLYSPLIQR